MRPQARTPVNDELGVDERVSLLGIASEHADHRLAELAASPATVGELQRQLLGSRWALESIERRRAAVSGWLTTHTPDSLLALDLRTHGFL